MSGGGTSGGGGILTRFGPVGMSNALDVERWRNEGSILRPVSATEVAAGPIVLDARTGERRLLSRTFGLPLVNADPERLLFQNRADGV